MREKILAVVEQIIDDLGTDFTMDQLASILNVSKRTLYENFASKEELIEVVTHARLQDICEQRKQILESSHASVEECLSKYFQAKPRGHMFYTVDILAHRYPRVIEKIKLLIDAEWERLQAYLLAQQKEGNISDVSIPTAIQILKLVTREVYFKHLEKKNWDGFPEAQRQVVEVVMNGLLVRKKED